MTPKAKTIKFHEYKVGVTGSIVLKEKYVFLLIMKFVSVVSRFVLYVVFF